MDIQFYFKKMDSSEALKNLAQKKLAEHLFKLMGPPSKVHFTFLVEKNMQIIHCSVTGRSGMKLFAEATSENMYNAVDQVCQKLRSQIRRYKTRIISGQKRRALIPNFSILDSADISHEFSIDAGDIVKMEAALRPYRERFLN